MIGNDPGYAANRRKSKEVYRLVVELPVQLISEVDEWGVSQGLTSRRAATEFLLKMGLEASHASTA